MSKIIFGIQGERGSTNEEAAEKFIEKLGLADQAEIRYLVTTEAVLAAVEAGQVDYGTFAVFVSAGMLVPESLEAMSRHLFQVVDALKIKPNHALLAKSGEFAQGVLPSQGKIYSHPMALAMHSDFLEKALAAWERVSASDTGLYAQKLSAGELPEGSLVIAPVRAAEQFGLTQIFTPDQLPINATYFTEILLVRRRDLAN